MSRNVLRCLLVALPLLFAIPQDEKPAPPAPTARPDMSALAFLAGSWSGEAWGGVFHAYYSTPEGGMVISHSRLEKEGKTAFFEFEVFEKQGDAVRLRPYPGGRPAVGLDLVSVDTKTRKAVFENPRKDYPTRIVYHRVADDRLVITLTDPHGASKKVETFDLKR